MKEIYLLCNAHLDPVWLWQRQEGMAEAISTFRVAAKFCEEYDDFIFNHNESVLYEWVEENEPELFAKIQKLVKEGKWKIVGGWYLQPDCVMPSGESLIRQIETGNRYFEEKFGIKTETAANFDSFGHTRGLVQILKKCGYKHYLFHRPYGIVDEENFIWKGYDGSEIIGHRTYGGYNSGKGKAAEKIDRFIDDAVDGPNLLLWGIGDHGGGPSRLDLEKIKEYAENHKDILVKHSSCDEYFSLVDKDKLTTVIDRSMVHCMVGCYTSMVRIKQLHRALENDLSVCEKMIATSGIDYDKNALKEAEKALLFCEFHDVLPGSMIKSAEEDSVRLLNYGREITSEICAKAFFKLCEGQAEGKAGEVPVLVFNPNPYPVTHDIEVEFQLEDQNWNDNEVTIVNVRDEKGNILPTQNEQEESNLNLDWRKRVVFRAELKPMCINRFDCVLTRINAERRPIENCEENETQFILKNKFMEVRIGKKTGLIEKYCVNGVDYITSPSGKIIVCQDNEDPWGMTVDSFNDRIGEFTLVSKDEANEFSGYPDESFENVKIIENGKVRCKIQATFRNRKSYAIVTYTIPKNSSYIDINVKTFINDVNTMYKLSFSTPFEKSQAISQMAFGREEMEKENKEVVCQKWCGLFEDGKGLAIFNKGTHGYSADKGEINISLLRTAVYAAHPIRERRLIDHDRFQNHIDMGERDFNFRLSTDISRLDKDAESYNQPAYSLAFFPSGNGEKKETSVAISDDRIIMSGYKKLDDGSVRIHLYNSTDENIFAELKTPENIFDFSFTPFEIKSFKINGKEMAECELGAY